MPVALPREHVRPNIPAERKHGPQVDLKHLVPVGVGEAVSRMAPLDAAAVDKDVDGVAGGEELRDEGGDAGWGGEVGGNDFGAAAEVFDGGFCCCVGFVALVGVSGFLRAI